ncbi:MAG TPA: hypothetical protein VGZ27_04940 [Vicinamibacterales bacterium]|jgi:hypothetical protein|nr:hypothetical protein [Vicinamibacterales bacterium]
MTRQMTAAWVVALGAGLLMMSAQAHGAAQAPATPQTPTQKTSTTQKPAVRKAAPAPKVPMTTMTGCLKMDGKQYQLTDVEGSQIEKSRSWKTGFITKSTKSVQVIGASSNVRLNDQVGRKVSVVGTKDIKDGETHLNASSIKRVSASCS